MREKPLYQHIFRHLPELETARLILRPVRLSDAKDMYEYARDTEVARYVLWESHRSITDSIECIRDLRRQYRHGWPSSFAIILKQNQKMIGTIGFMWVNCENRSAEVGYSLSRAYWHQGLMTEALKEILSFAFTVLRLHRVEAQHDQRNPASGKVMQHAGMQYEGLLHDRIFNKGSFCTVALYASINPYDTKPG